MHASPVGGFLLLWPTLICAAETTPLKVPIRCEIVDAKSQRTLAGRVYVRAADAPPGAAKWFFARSAAAEGSAVEYQKQRQPGSVEMHTTVSAHPFVVDVPAGTYVVTVERGKEYRAVTRKVEVGREPVRLRIELPRWIDMTAAGWYSGDTHVHRTIEELHNLLLAEDVNVGLPLSYWITRAYQSPGSGQRSASETFKPEPIVVDPTHVIYPINTEYEIFSVGPKRHTLGAVFALGHRRPFTLSVPPVGPVAEEARRQGALLDLDKHSWPWSLMLMPVMDVDLFELANNHVWRTPFGFTRWTEEVVPKYMNIERDQRGMTEWGWIDFGFQTYYALLNCGFRLRPTAGTASGVHPVPLGFGRVYVHLPDGFSYDAWMRGLDAGRSFVTTGPMLMIEVDGQPPGTTLRIESAEKPTCRIMGKAVAERPLRPIEVIVNGRVVRRLDAANRRTPSGGYESPIDARIELDGSSWLTVRVFEDPPDGRIRFAHGSPVHVEMPGRPLFPRREEIDYFIGRMREEIDRNTDVLRPEGLDEYRRALKLYEEIAKRAGYTK